jgi:putative ABC transport system permease protein
VSATLQNLYLLEGIEQLRLPPRFYALAAAMGLAGAWGGALLPALEIGRRSPRDLLASYTLEEATSAVAGRLLALGISILAATLVGYLAIGRGWKPAGFAVALGILIAVPLSAAWLVRAVAPRLRATRLSLAYGVRTLAARLQTAAVAVAALAVAVCMMVGVTIMIGSFRRTVEIWLDRTLRADVYVTTPSWRRGASEATLEPGIVERLQREPGVRAVDRLRQLSAYIGDRRISLSGFDAGLAEAASRVQLLAGDSREALRRVREEGAALVSEPLGRKEQIGLGDRLHLHGPRGELELPIAGVFYDYGAESGAALVSLATLETHFGKGPVTNVALYLDAGTDPEAMVDRLRAEFPGEALLVRSNRRLRQDVMGVFDETFAVTRLMQTASLVIAVCGIALTLLVLARERAAELALYRALGATRGQLFRVFLGRGFGIGLFGLVLGVAGGLGLALVLIHVINRDYFGWTIALHCPWRALFEEALAILAAALAASLYPAARASRTPATELSRDAL